MKHFMQCLWIAGIKWNDPIPSDLGFPVASISTEVAFQPLEKQTLQQLARDVQ